MVIPDRVCRGGVFGSRAPLGRDLSVSDRPFRRPAQDVGTESCRNGRRQSRSSDGRDEEARRRRRATARPAVPSGLTASARVITAAALIMISVFSSFVLGDDPTIKMFGVGLAVAVLLDATVVRMVIVPAVMSLAGKAAWWLPAGSTRLYPTSTSKAKHSSPASKPTPQSAPPPQPTASSSVQAGNNTRPSKGSAAWTGDT